MGKSAAMDFGVQSWCFHRFPDNDRVAEMVRTIGLDKIELCSAHADFGDPDAFAKVLGIYQKAGIRVTSIGVQAFKGETETERRWFECATMAGAQHISAHFAVDTYMDAIPATAALCEQYGIRIGIHCHGGYMFGGSPDVLQHLLKLGGPWFGVNLDTAWCMQLGPRLGQPVQWVSERFRGRIYGVHYKDFEFDRRATWRDVIVGTGNLDVPAFVQALESTGFDGMAAIEYAGGEADPVPSLIECVQRLRAASPHAAADKACMARVSS